MPDHPTTWPLHHEVDFILNRPGNAPIFSQELYDRCCSLALGDLGRLWSSGVSTRSGQQMGCESLQGEVLGEERVVGILAVHGTGNLAH